MQSSSLATLINDLVHSIETDAAALKQRHLLRQTLHALVRQAKAEQMAEMRSDVRRVTGLDTPLQARAEQAFDHDCGN
ncbi:MAG: hypothetical protein V4723_13775 [Pseudomonadota bacterium]